jgi:hypothetical protein
LAEDIFHCRPFALDFLAEKTKWYQAIGSQNQFSKRQQLSLDLGIRYRSGELDKGGLLRLVGCLLLLSGWLIALAALVMLTAYPERVAFVVAGLAVEVLGAALLTQGYRAAQKSQG